MAKALGQTTRQIRVTRAISQESLAGTAGIERSHMGKIERGEHLPTLAAIWRLSKALGTSPSELIAEVEQTMRRNQAAPMDTK